MSEAESCSNLPVAVVIVTWNSADEIIPCLASAWAQSPTEVVVVDNGSIDGTCELIERQFPKTQLVRFSANQGFAKGCNAGIEASSADYVLFLNGDATLEPNYLAKLLPHFTAHSKLASAVGKLVYEEKSIRYIDSAGINPRLYALSPLDRGYTEEDVGQFDSAGFIFGPSAAAALYSRQALNAAGPEYFDEDLFAYYEDVDLAWRLRNLGWQHYYDPAAMGFHCRRGPDNKPPEIRARAFSNRYLVWLKNLRGKELLYLPSALAWESVRLIKKFLVSSRTIPKLNISPQDIVKFIQKRQ